MTSVCETFVTFSGSRARERLGRTSRPSLHAIRYKTRRTASRKAAAKAIGVNLRKNSLPVCRVARLVGALPRLDGGFFHRRQFRLRDAAGLIFGQQLLLAVRELLTKCIHIEARRARL